MAQFLRGISNLQNTNITGSYTDIDETSASDSDFLYSADNVDTIYECGLTTGLDDPIVNTGHIVRYRIASIDGGVLGGGGSTPTVIVSLYQGATQIAADASKDGLDAWTTNSFTLTTTQANNITDYDNLRLHFDITGGGGGPSSRRGIGVSWAELEIPELTAQTYNEAITITSANVLSDQSIGDLHSDDAVLLSDGGDVYLGNIDSDEVTSLISDTNVSAAGEVVVITDWFESIELDSSIQINLVASKSDLMVLTNIGILKNIGKIK